MAREVINEQAARIVKERLLGSDDPALRELGEYPKVQEVVAGLAWQHFKKDWSQVKALPLAWPAAPLPAPAASQPRPPRACSRACLAARRLRPRPSGCALPCCPPLPTALSTPVPLPLTGAPLPCPRVCRCARGAGMTTPSSRATSSPS